MNASHWYEADSRFIAGHYQPATLIDLALSRDIDSHRLLRGTGLFYDDIVTGQPRLSPQQCFALIANDCCRGITARPATPCNRHKTWIRHCTP